MVTVIEFEGRENPAAVRDLHAGVLFGEASEAVGIEEFDLLGGGRELADIPAGVEHVLGKRTCRPPSGLDKANAPGSGAIENGCHSEDVFGMRVVCKAECFALQAEAG